MSYAVGLTLKTKPKYSKWFWHLIWALDIVVAFIIWYHPDLIVMGFK